jgi:hypothetical protein
VGRIEAGTLEPRVDTLERLLHAAGRELESAARSGDGVDRSEIREFLELTPMARLLSGLGQPGFDPGRMVSIVARQRVNFVLIGGLAARLHGLPSAVRELELCYSRAGDNAGRLGAALRELGARAVEAELRAGGSFSFKTSAGAVRCVTALRGVGSFAELLAGAEPIQVGPNKVMVASVDDLIANCRADGVPPDDLAALRDELETSSERMT